MYDLPLFLDAAPLSLDLDRVSLAASPPMSVEDGAVDLARSLLDDAGAAAAAESYVGGGIEGAAVREFEGGGAAVDLLLLPTSCCM